MGRLSLRKGASLGQQHPTLVRGASASLQPVLCCSSHVNQPQGLLCITRTPKNSLLQPHAEEEDKCNRQKGTCRLFGGSSWTHCKVAITTSSSSFFHYVRACSFFLVLCCCVFPGGQ
ncbi:hypothetical protein QOT17_002882 [Balamuthia mandrillaris]